MIKEWITNKILESVKLGGTLCTDEVYQKRMEICNGCEYKGIVRPLPFMLLKGCTICRCPFETKMKMDTYISLVDMTLKKVTCPHENGNKFVIIE